ncbi:MAG: 3-oxoacyl-ACP reductase [Candidatus Hydrogenedens sp.]|nr:3-oxoacyl-ACP reductase [Candidatus Hydrogenedens sp.]
MADFLVENNAARGIIKTLGLPLPLPQKLERSTGPWQEKPLQGELAVCGGAPGGAFADSLDAMLIGAGAQTASPDALADNARPKALVFDATAIAGPEGLRALYDFFHPNLRALKSCGRVVVLARTPDAMADALGAAAQRGIEGFVRSVGREIGRKGATTQTLYVEPGAEERVAPVLRWLLSPCSAYVSGQPVRVSGVAPWPGTGPLTQPLAGKVALVTGAARGIGEATAKTLAREGAKVIVMDRPDDLKAAEAVAKAIGGTALACDITDPHAAEKMLHHAEEHHGGLDIVVHNAGVTRDKTLSNMSEAQWDLVLNINLASLIRANEALRGSLREGGRIIALSSIGGIGGNVGQTNYAATKAGVIGYVRKLAPEMAARGITVNAIAPGFIETRMTAAIPMGTREVARRLCNLSQGGQPIDIAEAITFLASPGAAGITGETLRVCGGNFVGA